MRKKLEDLDGEGELLKDDGTSLGQRRYTLTVWQDLVDVGNGQTVDGLKSVEGRVAFEGGAAITLMSASLSLKLKDGRTLPFFFTDTTGRIAARGAFQ